MRLGNILPNMLLQSKHLQVHLHHHCLGPQLSLHWIQEHLLKHLGVVQVSLHLHLHLFPLMCQFGHVIVLEIQVQSLNKSVLTN